jgi:hypothetical protein
LSKLQFSLSLHQVLVCRLIVDKSVRRSFHGSTSTPYLPVTTHYDPGLMKKSSGFLIYAYLYRHFIAEREHATANVALSHIVQSTLSFGLLNLAGVSSSRHFRSISQALLRSTDDLGQIYAYVLTEPSGLSYHTEADEVTRICAREKQTVHVNKSSNRLLALFYFVYNSISAISCVCL